MSAQLGKCAQATRILLILLNILFLLLGIGLIAGGSVLVATGRNLDVLFSGSFSAVGISAIIIVAGIVIFIVSALAILGAIFKSRILLGIYLLALALIILVEIVVAIVGIVKRGELGGVLENTVDKLIQEYGQNRTDAREAIDFFQHWLSCCGWVNYTDYTKYSLPFPDSCDCMTGTTNCGADGQDIWNIGCRDGLLQVSTTFIGVIIAVAILFALVELIVVFCACGLCCCIHRGIDENNYTKV